jgi:hypothetical protein
VIFKDHGVRSFSGDYAEYFSSDTDHEGVEYLMLANHMLVRLSPYSFRISLDELAGFGTEKLVELPLVDPLSVRDDHRRGHVWLPDAVSTYLGMLEFDRCSSRLRISS